MGFATARKKAGYTQYEVANALRIDQSSVCLWETGKTRPRAVLLPKLAELYHCTIEELLAPDEANQDSA